MVTLFNKRLPVLFSDYGKLLISREHKDTFVKQYECCIFIKNQNNVNQYSSPLQLNDQNNVYMFLFDRLADLFNLSFPYRTIILSD